ncbi:MAG: aldo/keto reductase, partial [Pseudomonadota bacterium]|nr:aldo/keto reductase [Pseudomonadota bacterium]
MKYKTAGNKRVSNIGFGAGSCDLTPPKMQASFKEALQYALQQGVTLIDTAEVYSGGLSESLIGEVVAKAGCREEIFLSTKVSPEHLSREDLLRSLEGSLQRLRTDYVDLLMVH